MRPPEMNPDLFEPYDELIELTINGDIHKVPANNTLLRCFQYLSLESISYGDFCWNGDCLNCKVRIRTGEKEKDVIACIVKPEDGTEVISVSDDIRLDV
jgi:hypothetical protein